MLEVPPTYLEVPQKALSQKRQMDPPLFESTFDRKPLHVLFQVYPNGCSQVSNTQIQRVQIQNYTNTGYGIPKLFAEYIQYHV